MKTYHKIPLYCLPNLSYQSGLQFEQKIVDIVLQKMFYPKSNFYNQIPLILYERKLDNKSNIDSYFNYNTQKTNNKNEKIKFTTININEIFHKLHKNYNINCFTFLDMNSIYQKSNSLILRSWFNFEHITPFSLKNGTVKTKI
jgi:hypothetical protein